MTSESEVNVQVKSYVQLFATPWMIQSMEYPQARILEWVAIAFSRGSSQLRDQILVSCTASGFFTSWAQGSPLHLPEVKYDCDFMLMTNGLPNSFRSVIK